MTSAVVLDTKMTESLKQMGASREIVNKIQKLRKAVNISIDDEIEVFYSSASAGSLGDVLTAHKEKIATSIKRSFLPVE